MITGNATDVLIIAYYLCHRGMLRATIINTQKKFSADGQRERIYIIMLATESSSTSISGVTYCSCRRRAAAATHARGSAARMALHHNVSDCINPKQASQAQLTAQAAVQHPHREITRRLLRVLHMVERTRVRVGRLDEPDDGAAPATVAHQHGRIVEIAQQRSAARGRAGVAVSALVPRDELLDVDLEEDVPDDGAAGGGGALVGEVGGELPDGEDRGVQDPLAAVERLVQEVCCVARRGRVAEDAVDRGVPGGAREGDHHWAVEVVPDVGAFGSVAGDAWEDGVWEGHLGGCCLVGLGGG